jgi:serine/threonine protein kinase
MARREPPIDSAPTVEGDLGRDSTAVFTPSEDEVGSAPAPELPRVSPSAYQRGRALGAGGLGVVVEARDARLGRTVALKELRSDSRASAARFVREALVTARLQHPGIVPIYEAGRWPDGAPFYAMKLVAGTSLAQAITARPTLGERLALLPALIAATEAIAYAHAQRVIHRDLKPHNIMLGEFGETLVIDWGLAKDLAAPASTDGGDSADGVTSGDSAPEHTAAGAVLGTAG